MTGGEELRHPADAIPSEVASRIRLVLLDVDGVLTDGGLYVGVPPDGQRLELKRFDIQDGLGIRLLRAAGVEVAAVSGRFSAATEARAHELGIEECHQDRDGDKLPLVRRLLERKGYAWEEVAHVADDLADLPVLRAVALPVAVANAVPEVRREALWCTSRPGGRGAVREFVRRLLEARGEWDAQVAEYVRRRSQPEPGMTGDP